jgi:hypothetical protein
MDERTVRVLNALGDGMGRIKVIVPEENQGTNQLLAVTGELRPLKHLLEGVVQSGLGLDAGPRSWTKPG